MGVVAQRYLKTSIVMTTNHGIGEGEVLGNTTVAESMLDWLLHRSRCSISPVIPTVCQATTLGNLAIHHQNLPTVGQIIERV